MNLHIENTCADFNTYRAARVKSLFNANEGHTFRLNAELDLESAPWKIGLVVGPSGSGKTSIGRRIFGDAGAVADLYQGWPGDAPIVDAIGPGADFNDVTGALAAVGLGDVPAWLRPFHALSNGQQFRAGLARLIVQPPTSVVVDEFTSVVDRQMAKVGALAFAKAWRRTEGHQVVLLSPHYDILEWLAPDWVYDTGSGVFARDCLRRPPFELKIQQVNGSYWPYFKPHHYLDLPLPPVASCFVGTVDGEPVCHVAVSPFFTANAYRAMRLVVMPEWQGVGVGTRFLEWVCQYHAEGRGRCGRKLPTLFHTSHPQLVRFLNHSPRWVLKSQSLYGGEKAKSARSITKAAKASPTGKVQKSTGYGGHFRAVQGFKYIGGPTATPTQ